jgi:hypothetical protein
LTPSADIGELVRQAILALALIIVAAKVGGELLGRLGQSPVLGELLIGVVVGNLGLFGITAMEPLRDKYDASRRCGDWSDPSFIRGGRGIGSGLVARSGLVVPRGCDAGSDRSDGHGILCFQLVAAGIRMVNSLIRWRHSNRNQRRNYGARTQGFG